MKCGCELIEAIVEAQREYRKIRSSGLILEILPTLDSARRQIAMGKNDAFRFAGASRSIKDGGHIAVNTTMGVDMPSLRERILPSYDLEICSISGDWRCFSRADHYHCRLNRGIGKGPPLEALTVQPKSPES